MRYFTLTPFRFSGRLPTLFGQRRFHHLSSGLMYRGLVSIGAVAGQFVNRIRQQTIFDLGDGEIAKVVDEIAPRVVQPG
jgi:hypothetical protein